MSKHEYDEVSEKIFLELRATETEKLLKIQRGALKADDVVISQSDFISTIKKVLCEYFPVTPVEPELVAGRWVETDTSGLCCVTELKPLRGLNLMGKRRELNHSRDFYKPHTFTESDLALLNTGEVKYELRNDGDMFFVGVSAHGDKRITTFSYPTTHEAIESAFNAVLGENLRLREVKK